MSFLLKYFCSRITGAIKLIIEVVEFFDLITKTMKFSK